MKKAVALLALSLLVLAGWINTPPSLSSDASPPAMQNDPSAGLAQTDAAAARAFGLVPGTERRLLWRGVPGQRTEFAVIYLHGFSASRQEIAPVPELIAEALGANLFETRLKGHGRIREPLEDVQAEDWIADGAEALAVGRAIGERLIVIGTSTGATLAIAMADHELFDAVDTLILMSPNYGPRDPASEWLTRPFGPLIARAMVGEYREWQPANDRQAEFWTTRYPTAAVIEMMRLVEVAAETTARVEVPRALLLYSPEDRVVSVDKLLAAFERLPAGSKDVVAISETKDPGRHVLAGDILSPETTAPTVERVVNFVIADRIPR